MLILMHKVKSGRTQTYLTDLFQLNCEQEGKYNLRNSDFRRVHYRTVTHGKHSISHLGPSLWAKLSKKERIIKSMSEFRPMIRKKDLSAETNGCGTNCYLCTN